MNRWNIINKLIKDNNYQSYLEIGYGNGETYNKIDIKEKTGVDKKGKAEYVMPSEEFFLRAKERGFSYDIIFIDGCHRYNIVKMDISSSLDILNIGGTIVMHDCNPTTEKMQRTDILITDFWTGDVWKAFVELKANREDLEMYVVDTDFGCGVIKKGSQKLIKCETDLTYKYLDKNRKRLLNLISIEEFKKL